MRVLRAGTVLLVVATVLSLTSGPAAAADRTFTDRANDAPRGVDIRSVKVLNDGPRIIVRTKFDQLRRNGSTGLSVYFDTNRRNRGPEYAAVGGLFEGTDWTALRVDGWRDRSPRLLMRCDIDLRTRYGRQGTATYDIARRCFGSPGAIRVAATSGAQNATDWAPRRHRFYPRRVSHN